MTTKLFYCVSHLYIVFSELDSFGFNSVVSPAYKNRYGADKMAQGVKAPADDLSSSPETHMIEGESHLLQIVLWPVCSPPPDTQAQIM